MAPPERKHKRPVGAGLSLGKFAALGVSKFDKRKKLERIKREKIIKYSKYKKIKQKLEAQGILSGAPIKDSVAELEALDVEAPSGSGGGSDHEGDNLSMRHVERIRAHAQADYNSKAQPGYVKQARTPGTTDAGEVLGASGPVGQGQLREPGSEQGSGGRKRARVDGNMEAPSKEPNRPSRSGGKHHTAAPEAQVGEPMPVVEREGSRDRGPHGAKRRSQLQRLAKQVAEEKAEKQRAKDAAQKEREERMKKVAAVEESRKVQKHLYFKRNAKGQPLMRYRMEKLLSQIQDAA